MAGEGVTSVYDGFGRLVSSSSNMGGTARSVGHHYDANGNRIRIIHPDGSYFTSVHDGLDRRPIADAPDALWRQKRSCDTAGGMDSSQVKRPQP